MKKQIDMANLIIPNKNLHKYVVGIDFGHGETSAAVCELEWNKDAGQREDNLIDLDMDIQARKKVIPSAICHTRNGIVIGDAAFEHISDNEGIRIGFKECPKTIDGEKETLMIDYMRAVYGRIREADDRLTDNNHIVYIARPSGWQAEEVKEVYRQMAIKAGIPLGGLTSESRAAIFYAKSPRIGFANNISKGAIVFDLGSSTVDFTYLSDNDKPIDDGYPLGASIIDDVIYHSFILNDDNIAEFIEKHPEYEGALRFKARKFKEYAYSRDANYSSIQPLSLCTIIPEDEPAYEEYCGVTIILKIKNIEELNDLIEEKRHYISELKSKLEEYRDKTISGKKINGVFLTGGASRMNFIRRLIAETLKLSEDNVKYDKDNPSLTISRGIALLGTADAVTSVLVAKLKSKIPELLTDDKIFKPLTSALSNAITNEAWKCIETACDHWVKFGNTTGRDELKKIVEYRLKEFKNNDISPIINSTLQTFIKDVSESIRKEMNKIISRYAPGQEITMSGSATIGNQKAIADSLKEMNDIIQNISKSMGDIIADALWVALGIFLWGVFVAPYYILKAILTSDESKRKDKVKDILKQESDIKTNLFNSIYYKLEDNKVFKNEVSTTLQKYFHDVIDLNIQKVIIPIE